MARRIIITTCTKNKSTSEAPGVVRVMPSDYLANPQSVALLNQTRATVWTMPGSGFDPTSSEHHAFDLYVSHPETQLYRQIRELCAKVNLRSAVLAKHAAVEWYFLSAGYGVVHAQELARPYQATFTRAIAKKNNIPFTGTIWKRVLPGLLDEVFNKSPVTSVHVFASKDYMEKVKATNFFRDSGAVFDLHPGRANAPELVASLVATARRLYSV